MRRRGECEEGERIKEEDKGKIFMDWDLKTPSWDLAELERESIPNIAPLVGSSSFQGQNTKGDCSVDLKLGRLGDFGDGSLDKLKDPRISTVLAPPSGSTKRSRAPSNGTQTVSCLVDGCKSDLTNCRDYHRRHKVCELHSKTPKVMVGGQEQRFCQQCSRFHLLVEFDEVKRSCRKRLDGHNRRRRKPHPESLSMNSGSLFTNHQDYALSEETVIVGDESGCFLYSSGDDSLTSGGSQGYFSCKNTKQPSYGNYNCDAVALVFARDRGKPHGLGEIQFHLALSTGVSPVGPTYKGASVRVNKGKESACSTWLTARREGFVEKFDGQRILHDIDDEMGNGIFCDDLYIGVVKRRKCSIGSEKGRLVSSLAFHEVLGGDEEYLYVKGNGIKTGDPFRFYHPDPKVALTSRNNVFEDFRILKQDLYCKGCHHVRGTAEAGERKLVFGGLVFSCYGRGESFFGCPKVDSLAFLEDFPGIPLAGMFCGGEIGRGFASSAMQYDSEERSTPSCCLHVYSTVYLVMLYTSKSPEC
uniref:SBP-type domain-containing protein n=1 Tax=Nelumbo nucifera TaxID=4432 RepID=A0A822YEE1_NELNU|nr:TPA_asm: hypothetical protein HUJ06_009374 [Nelumbo nucifera]